MIKNKTKEIFLYSFLMYIKNIFVLVGKVLRFFFKVVISIFKGKNYWRLFWEEFIEICFYSIPIVSLTIFFTGMVLALQSYTGFSRFNVEGAIANVVGISITRELAPVMSALMVAGRISSSIAAKISTMKVTEQINALYSMFIDPIKYLITPKLYASIIALPILIFLADILGIMGGFTISVYKFSFIPNVYIQDTWNFLTYWDILSGIIKGFFFGIIIAMVGSYFGFYNKGTTKDVGRATTNAVVVSSILILICDYFLTMLFF